MKNIIKLSLIILMLFVSITTVYAAETNGLKNDTVYNIQNVYSGKYLNVVYGRDVNGTNVIQYDKDGTIEQNFRLLYNYSTNSYKLYGMCSSNGTNRVIDVYRPIQNGANIDFWTPDDNPAQELIISYVGNGRYKVCLKSNTNLVLTVYGTGNGTTSGTSSTSVGNVFVSNYTGSDSQHWYFKTVSYNKEIKTNSSQSVNSGYNRDNAAYYAYTYAVNHNSTYDYYDENCTNFVSQALYNGGLSMTSGTIYLTDRDDYRNWFYWNGFPADWVARSWTLVSKFYEHWGGSNLRAYQSIKYSSGMDALSDMNFLVNTIKKGDVIQLMTPNNEFLHSVVVHDVVSACDGVHAGNTSNYCDNVGHKEILYASNTSDYVFGHLNYLLKAYKDYKVVIIRIKNG